MVDEDILMRVKWWDYRLLEPRIATFSFIRDYALRVPRYLEDLGQSRYVNILKELDVDNPECWKHWSRMNATRQWCDSNGMTYDEYWSFATEEHLRMGWHTTFANAFCGEKMRQRVFLRFKENRSQMIKVSKHPFFRASGYVGCKLQDAYFSSLIKEVRRRYGVTKAAMNVIVEMVDDDIIPRRFFLGGY